MAICQHLGVRADVAELAELAGAGENGTSLLGLSDAAGSIGLKCLGLKVTLAELAAVSLSAVIHVWGNHFIPIESTGVGGINLLETDGDQVKSISVSMDYLQAQYSGFALIVAREADTLPQFATTTGPDLRIGEYVHYFGVADAGYIRYSVKYRNAGTQELVVSDVKSSCGCGFVTPSVDNGYKLAPGAEGEFTIVIDAGSRWGPQDFRFTVFSNDPVTPVVELGARGAVRSGWLGYFPNIVNFGNVRQSDRALQTVYVPDSTVATHRNYSDTALEIRHVASDSPFVVPSVHSGPTPGKPGYSIQVLLKPGAPVGLLKGKIMLETTHERQPRAEIPFTANVTGDLVVVPGEVFFGAMKAGDTKSQSLVISTTGATTLKILKVENPLRKYLSLKVTPVHEGREYLLTASFKKHVPAGVIHKDIVIRTNDPDKSRIRVPIFALIQN